MTTYYRSVTLTFPEPVAVEYSTIYAAFRTQDDTVLGDVNKSVRMHLHEPFNPLPTTPGSVIKTRDGAVFVLKDNGWWYNVSDLDNRGYGPNTMSGFSFTVLHTAPKES